MSASSVRATHRPALPPVFVEGLAVWAPRWPSWSQAQAAFRGEDVAVEPPAKRPAPLLLPPTERRRAPDTVALALEVASQAIDGSGQAAADLPCVFTSAHGDLAINDTMCSTLAESPTLLSPTKFHNSVHNAAAGYWTMGTGCMQTSTAVSAFEHSFAAGLLEALSFCVAEQRAVLLVGYDTQACGALSTVTKSQGLLAVALVLAPQRSAHTRIALDWALGPDFSRRTALRSSAAQSLSGNAMADALPLFEALAQPALNTGPAPVVVDLPLSSHSGLRIHLRP
ncbi:MAG: beta-ketoacyl synthase chain length factor [Pseudomonadota bacterium]